MPSVAIGIDSVVKKYFNSYRKKGTLPPLLKGKLKAKLIEELPGSFYYNNSDGSLLWGRLDECVILEDGKYSPLDFKTRSSSPKEIHPVFQFQMDVYTFLLEKNGLPVNNKAFLLYFYPQEGPLHEGFPFTAEIHELKTDPGRAEKVFKDALKALKAEMPSASEECEYCKWLEAVTIREKYI